MMIRSSDMNKTPGSSPPIPSAIKDAIARLEEKCAVIDAAEAAWDSRQLSDDTKLRILISVRRTLIDVIVGLEENADIQ